MMRFYLRMVYLVGISFVYLFLVTFYFHSFLQRNCGQSIISKNVSKCTCITSKMPKGRNSYVSTVSNAKVFTREKEALNYSKQAFGFHASSETHLYAALVNIERLKKLSSFKVDYVILTNVRPRKWAHKDIRLVPYPQLSGPDGYYRECMTKLLFFNMTEYNRIIYMDTDAIVLKSLDELFYLPSHVGLASPIAYWENEPCFTGALLVISPDEERWADLHKQIDGIVEQSKTEMDLLIIYYQHKLGVHAKIFPDVLILPGYYLVLSLHFRDRVHGYDEHRELQSSTPYSDLDDLAGRAFVIHFSGGPKPWSLSYSNINSYEAISPYFYKFNKMFKDEFHEIKQRLNE